MSNRSKDVTVVQLMLARSNNPDYLQRVTDSLKAHSAEGFKLQLIPAGGGTIVRCSMNQVQASKMIRKWRRNELGPAFALNHVTDFREVVDEIQAIIRFGGFPDPGQVEILRKDLLDHRISIQREQLTSFRLWFLNPRHKSGADGLEEFVCHMLIKGSPADIRWIGERIAFNNIPEVEGHAPIPRFHDNLHPHFVPLQEPAHAEPPGEQRDQLCVEGTGDEAGLLCSFYSRLHKVIDLEYADGAVLEDMDGSRPWRIVLRWAPSPGRQRTQVNQDVLKIIDDWFARTSRTGRRVLTVNWIPTGVP